MTGDAAAGRPPYERLTPDFVMDAVESLGYRCDARILTLNSYENRVYQIGIEDESPLIGKFYRPKRWTDEQIIEEHTFLDELAELDTPVVMPITHGESTLATYEGFRFSLFPQQGGRAPDLDNIDNLAILARFIGRMHSAASRDRFLHRPALTVDSFGREPMDYVLENDFVPLELVPAYEATARALVEEIDQLFRHYSTIDTVRLHGDCHVGNVLWRDDRPHFVDFDDCRSGPAIQDLWMLLSGRREHRQRQLAKIVRAYDDFYEFNPAELRLIEPLRALRMMHHAGWIAKRWSDPAFPAAFPWFGTDRYWSEHILELKEQLGALNEPPLELY